MRLHNILKCVTFYDAFFSAFSNRRKKLDKQALVRYN